MSVNKKEPVLALFDFRAKQKFIYRTNRIKEIVGASEIIKNSFVDKTDDNNPNKFNLINVAKKNNIDIIDNYDGEYNNDMFQENESKGIIVYEGGGNLNILFDSAETCQKLNKAFSKELLERYYGLNMICSYVPAELDKQNFYATRRKLYQKHSMVENIDISIDRCNVLPFVQVDRKTSFPLTSLSQKKNEKLSKESKSKLDAYNDFLVNEKKKIRLGVSLEGTELLDNYIYEKGVESLLAVVFIDGNNMGAYVAKKEDSDPKWESAIESFSKMSREINETTVVAGYEAMDEYLTKKVQEKILDELGYGKYVVGNNEGIEIVDGKPHIDENIYEKLSSKDKDVIWRYCYRKIVGAGDEATFICNARLAYEISLAYVKEIPIASNGIFTSCAGIAVFHSHTPFSDAYRIAEECCDSAKEMAHKMENTSWIDFEYCQSGINSSLDVIRQTEQTSEKSSRPWRITTLYDKKNIDGCVTDETVSIMKDKLNNKEIGRNNIKNLLTHAFNSEASFENELNKIIAHHNLDEDNFFSVEGLNQKQRRQLIYDLVLMFDIWFDENRV